MSESFDPYYTWLGIPPQQQPPNHYRLLGIELFESNPDVIESAADQRMAHLRSFQTGKHGHLTQKLLNEVAAAKICLLDAKKKAEHDATLQEKLATQQAEAVEADVFSSFDEAASTASSVSTTAKGKPKPNMAMIVGVAVASVAVVLIAIWVFLSGRKLPNESRAVATRDQSIDADKKAEAEKAAAEKKAEEERKAKAEQKAAVEKAAAEKKAAEEKAAEEAKMKAEAEKQAAVEKAAAEKKAAEEKAAAEKKSEEPKKRPIPSAEIQREVGDNVEKVYKVSEAATPEAKIKLAKVLSEEAKKSGSPDEQFVLLRKAADLACDGGDAPLMLEMLDPMASAFAIDSLNARVAMLERFAKGPRNPARLKSLVDSSAGVIDDAMAEDHYEIAFTLAKTVVDACARSSPALRKEAADRRKRVAQLQKQFHEFEKASAALKASPEDAEARLAVGAWHCFVKDDWETGLAHLAKGSDAVLKALANRELDLVGAAPEDHVKLADAWWDAAQDRRGDESVAMLRRAGYWYEQAFPNLQGVNKTKAEQRRAEIAKLGEGPALPSGRRPPLAIAPFDAKRARWFQVHWARYLKVPVEFTNSIGMKFVLIPPGEFEMGSPQEFIEQETRVGEAWSDGARRWYRYHLPGETPRHHVRITNAFYMGVTEVTQKEYVGVMGANPSFWRDDPNKPVERVTWNEAAEFCRRLSQVPGGRSAKCRYQLPTEAQWEYASRAGSTGYWCFIPQDGALPGVVDERSLGEYAWFGDNAGAQTHPVGQKRANAWGLHDIHGNVFEWCADWYERDYYAKSPPEDPQGPPGGSERVFRGGCWGHPGPSGRACRSAYRLPGQPEQRLHDRGFRVAGTLLDVPETIRPTSAKAKGSGDVRRGEALLPGEAQYRAQQWQAALAAIEESRKARSGGNAADWFLLAMTQWKLGNPQEAYKWYFRAAKAVNTGTAQDNRRSDLREEARLLLRIPTAITRPIDPGRATADVPPGAVLFMDFEKDTVAQQGEFLFVRDLSGGENHGAGTKMAYSAEGKIGGGLECRDGAIHLPTGLLTNLPQYTVAAWVYASAKRDALRVYQQYTSGGGAVGGILAPSESCIWLAAWHKDTPDNWIHVRTPPRSFPEDQWFFFAARFQESTPNKENLTVTINDRSYRLPFQRVAYEDREDTAQVGGGTKAICVLDELLMYPRALSDAEIDRLYRRASR